MLRYILAFGLVLGMSALGGPAFGKTPDGVTPAVETECVGLTGAAFGLCNAYCEAQDCDVLDPERKSCQRLRDNFLRHTGLDIFPCDPVICEDQDPALDQCTDGTCPEPEECLTTLVCPTTGRFDPACEQVCDCVLPCDAVEEANRCSEGACPPGTRCVTPDPVLCKFPCPACICEEECPCNTRCEAVCSDGSTAPGSCQDDGGDNCSCVSPGCPVDPAPSLE